MSGIEVSNSPVIVVHGGAWAVPEIITEATVQSVKTAAKIGYKVLHTDRTAVDAVIAAVSHLEDDPIFNAGRGADLNTDGKAETHAMIMRGDTLQCGGVVGLTSFKNPIEVARLVMEKSHHCVLGGRAATQLARENSMCEVANDYFVTDSAREQLQKMINSEVSIKGLFTQEKAHDTVGAVALDNFGNVACATTTGGISGQIPGRIPDSPIPGAGGYADNESIAISTTGHGESSLKLSLARLCSCQVEQGMAPQISLEHALQRMKTRVDGYGGAIAVDKKGRTGIAFTTSKMSWAVIGGDVSFAPEKSDSKIAYGILPGEVRIENAVP